jgi:hypothetical protein
MNTTLERTGEPPSAVAVAFVNWLSATGCLAAALVSSVQSPYTALFDGQPINV